MQTQGDLCTEIIARDFVLARNMGGTEALNLRNIVDYLLAISTCSNYT